MPGPALFGRRLRLPLALLLGVLRCAATAGYGMHQCAFPPMLPQGCQYGSTLPCCPMVPPFDTFRQRQAQDPFLIKQLSSLDPLASPEDGLSVADHPPMVLPLPEAVLVGLTVHRIFDINYLSQTFSMHYKMRVLWRDCRLLHNCSWLVVPLSHPRYNKFWRPTYKFEEQESFDGGIHDETFSFSPDGLVSLEVGRVGTFRCAFDFTDLPFDSQRCNLTFIVPLGDTSILTFIPITGPNGEEVIVQVTDNAEWKIDTAWTFRPIVVWRELWSTHVQMNALQVSFGIHRRPRSMLMNYVFPAVMYYLISWLGLWIDSVAVPARAAIGVIPVLIMTNKLGSLSSTIPPISYSVRLENFLISTLTFIVLQMLEFGFVNYGLRRRQQRKKEQAQHHAELPGRPAVAEAPEDGQPAPSSANSGWLSARHILRTLEGGQSALHLPDRTAEAVSDNMDIHFRWISILAYSAASIIILCV